MSKELDATRGVLVHYGPRVTEGKYGSVHSMPGAVKQAEYVFDFDDLPADQTSNIAVQFPAYSKILNGYVEVLEAATTGGDRTSITVGTTIGDATGLDFSLALTTLTAARGVSDAVVIDPPLDVGTSAAEMVVTLAGAGGTTGDVTAGKFRIVVEYLPEGA